MRCYEDEATGLIISVVDDKGVGVTSRLTRIGVQMGAHGDAIAEMMANPKCAKLSDVPFTKVKGESNNIDVYEGLTLDEVIAKCEEVQL